MRSATETKHRKVLSNKLSLLIMLWILDKVILFILFWFF